MQYRLRLYPYSGGHDDLIGEGELKECRARANTRIRYHRTVRDYPVSILERGMKWELETGEDAAMIGDREGILAIEPICERCSKRMPDDDSPLCEDCEEQDDEDRAAYLDAEDSEYCEDCGVTLMSWHGEKLCGDCQAEADDAREEGEGDE